MPRSLQFIYTLGVLLSLFCTPIAHGDADPTIGLNYYQVLKVDRNADLETITRARNAAAKEHHGDVNPSSESRYWMRAINKAYEVLKRSDQRAIYDFETRNEDPPAAASRSPYSPTAVVIGLMGFFPLRETQVSVETLKFAHHYLLLQLGNPAFMVHSAQRRVFYRDVQEVLELVTEQRPLCEGAIAVLLNLLLRDKDSFGEQIFDEIYSRWKQIERSGYPNDNRVRYAPIWIEMADLIEAKAGRQVAPPQPEKPLVTRKGCKGDLVDRKI